MKPYEILVLWLMLLVIMGMCLAILIRVDPEYQHPRPAVAESSWWRAVNSTAPCTRTDALVVVDLGNRKHRHILDHVWDAWRQGQPKRLHIARNEADDNRDASLKGIPTKPGFDRDEYPPAMSDEGGAGASVRYVGSSENRSAGAVMGNQLSDFCNGQRFRFERRPR